MSHNRRDSCGAGHRHCLLAYHLLPSQLEGCLPCSLGLPTPAVGVGTLTPSASVVDCAPDLGPGKLILLNALLVVVEEVRASVDVRVLMRCFC